MTKRQPLYLLTQTAENDFRAAKSWSRKRWGAELTRLYFQDLHEGAECIARNWRLLPAKDYLTGDKNLGIHPVREHYIVFVPSVAEDTIIIVALIRQTRDVPAILRANSFAISRALQNIVKS